MVNYVTRFAALGTSIEAMLRTPPYEVLRWRWYPDVSGDRLRELEEYVAQHQGISDFYIPPSMRALYALIGGWELSWVYQDSLPLSGRPPLGHSILMHPLDVFSPVDEDSPNGGGDDVPYDAHYRLLDWIGVEDEVVLKFHRGVNEPKIFYHHVPSDTYHPLALDVPAYIDRLLQCRALSPWQQFFITTPGFRVADETARVFFDSLARLFPDADPAPFRR